MLSLYAKLVNMVKIILGVIGIAIIAALAYSILGKMNKKVILDEKQQAEANSIHELTAEPLLSDEEVALSKYKGNVLLVVNTASKCGLTPQYEDLQKMHEEYSTKGLSILGFPSNDFMSQEPGSEEEIASFCEKNYGVEFDMFEKVKVKGNDKHPVYQFLTEKEKNGVLDSNVQWNFQKYLLDKDGKLVAVFNPKVSVYEPEVVQKIDSLLNQTS